MPPKDRSLAPYVPRLVRRWIVEAPTSRHLRLEATMVFVDVSGFTQLSERLARQGKVGAEVLAETIDTCFVALLAVAAGESGDLLKFGGDALLVLFSGADHAGRACRAAFEMRRTLRDLGEVEVFDQALRLRMSVGVHTGPFDFFLVGSSHRELIVTGPSVTHTVAMEAAADAGEILVSESTAALLQRDVVGAAKGGGLLLRRAPVSSPTSSGFDEPDAIRRAPDGSCLSAALRGAVGTGLAHPEHRRVTMAFVHFDGIDEVIDTEGPDAAADHLEVLVTAVQECCDRLSVTFLASDVDTDGGKIILAAGAPTTAGDDEGRMLSAVRYLMDRHTGSGSPLTLRVGVNRDSVFVGDIGPRDRRTYTAMGDGVNLTARLMARAEPGEILATTGVLERSERRFVTTAVPPFNVKGKAAPVHAFLVGRAAEMRSESTATATPFVGRADELASLLELLRSSQGGVGGAAELVGDPGIGKTRLLAELCAAAQGTLVFTLRCDAYQASTPYFAFRDLVRGLVSYSQAATEDEARRHLEDRITSLAPDLVPWVPLLGPVLGLSLEDTAETAQLDEEFRRPRLGRVLIRLLDAACASTMLLVVDDVHWMDEASFDLLAQLAAAADGRPWAVVIARRPDSSYALLPQSDPRFLAVGPLAEAESAGLVEVLTAEAPIPRHETAAVAERSGGNPLFVQELVAARRTSEDLGSLPDSVESLIATRIDQLAPEARMLLRRAAVLGRTFSLQLLESVSETSLVEWKALDEFLEQIGEDRLMFRHALVRDCAYDGLPYRLRRALHSQVADALEAGARSGERPVELLSLHYYHALRYGEAWECSLEAARGAERAYANVLAAEFYRRAIEAGRRIPGFDSLTMAATREALGDALSRAGEYGAAVVAYQSARRVAGAGPVVDARRVLKLGRMMGWLDRYSHALRWISRGLRILQGVPGEAAGAQRAQLMAWYGRFCQEKGDHAQALKWSELAAAEAEAAGDLDALANALKVLDWARMDLGTLDRPVNWERALSLFEQLGDLTGQASILNFIGGFAYFRGDWNESASYYRRAQAMVKRTGSSVTEAHYLTNLAEIDLEQGALDDAESQLAEASRIWRAAGYRRGTASVYINLGRLAAARGRFQDAFGLLEAAVKEALGVGSQSEALDARSRLAECLLVSGRPAEALAEVDAAMQTARALGGVAPQAPLLYRVRGAALLALGNRAEAQAALDEALRSGRARQSDYHVALTLQVLAEMHAQDDPETSSAYRAESDCLLQRLGVVWLPKLLADGDGGAASAPPTADVARLPTIS